MHIVKQMKYNKKFVDKLTWMTKFVCLYYVRQWLECPLLVDVPLNDIQWLNYLKKYQKIDIQIGGEALRKLDGHYWYLTEEIVPLSLFSNKLSLSEKRQISKKLLKIPKDQKPKLGIPIIPQINKNKKKYSIPEFIGDQSLHMFNSSGCTTTWLTQPPEKWEEDPDYVKMKNIFSGVKYVNDPAERCVKLIEDYSSSIVRDEEEKQYLLQLVEKHRRDLPTMSKKALSKL